MLNNRFRNEILPLKDKLFRLAFRITLDSAEAEDIVQETMIRVWNKREEWSQLNSIEAYCMTVARNMALDRIEKKEAHAVSLSDEMSLLPIDETPERTYEVGEQWNLVKRIIDELPEKQRTIIQLRDIEGKTYNEIAQVLELSEEQVKVNLHRARQKIRTKVNEVNNYGL